MGVTRTVVRTKKRSIRRMIWKRLRKIFYKVADQPLFEQKMWSFAIMIGGVICMLLEPTDCGGGVFAIAVGLLVFCTKKNLFGDNED